MPWDLQMGESRGTVIDERFNGGGAEAEYVVDYLRRRLLSYWGRVSANTLPVRHRSRKIGNYMDAIQ